MTIDLEPVKKANKKRKDRTSEVTGDGEDASKEIEERKKRRKERKSGKEGAIDGALSFSLFPCSLLTRTPEDTHIDGVAHVKKSKHKKSATVVHVQPAENAVADEIGTCHAPLIISLGLRP